MILLEKVYEKRYWYGGNINNIRGRRLEWLFETKRILNGMTRTKLKNNHSSYLEEEKHFSTEKESSKVIDVHRENIETLKGLESTLGITLPEYFKDGFVKRTSYSISKYMNDIEETVKSQLLQQGIQSEDIDTEFAKFIIYVKMVQPLSSIVQKSKAEKNATALEGIEQYSDVYNFVMDNIQDATDYSTLKSKTKKYRNDINLSKETDSKIIGEESQELEETPPSLVYESEENQFPIIFSPEKVDEIVFEIENLNRECISLSEYIKGLSRRLQSTQTKIKTLKQSLHGTLDNPEVTEDKGDIDK